MVVSNSKQAPVISLLGLILTIDGQKIDLSTIPVGGQAESDTDLLQGIVTRDEVTVNYLYSTDIYESNQSTKQQDYEFDITEGTIACPLKRRSA